MSDILERITVLDSGFVQYVDHMGSDLTIVNAARVSFDKESSWEEVDHEGKGFLSAKDSKLLNYLADHEHWTPFAHPQITLRIKAPISIRTQLFKHKIGFVENEISRRYVSYQPDVYHPFWRGKPTGGAKQGSEDFINDSKLKTHIDALYKDNMDKCIAAYEELIESGIAPEQARFILPQGVYTEWWWTGSLSAYARVYNQRIEPHAQWEVREYAKAIGKIIEELFPEAWTCLTEKTKY
jgi:thymidylate synthase (FAD)